MDDRAECGGSEHDAGGGSAASAGRGYPPISDYALIGDAQSGALVASDGSIDWLCLPHFDDPAVLCRLLDNAKGGYLALRPATPGAIATSRRYRPASNVLETVLSSDGGVLRLVDAMPLAANDPRPLDGVWEGRGRHRVVRLLEVMSGAVDVVLEARLGFDFAATEPSVDLVPGARPDCFRRRWPSSRPRMARRTASRVAGGDSRSAPARAGRHAGVRAGACGHRGRREGAPHRRRMGGRG